jgi:hypothetical protein
MSLASDAPATRSEKLFQSAFHLALEGNHRDSDEILDLAHEMRELELRLAEIAEHAPGSLAVLLVKAAMTGFTDETDPARYIATNRESIRMYAENDQQLHKLMHAIFNPTEYRKAQFTLSDRELNAAREGWTKRFEDEPARKAVGDKIITPAAIGLLSRGFKEFTREPGGGSILRQCQSCLNKYSTKVHLNNRIFWYCPHCNAGHEA